MWDHLENRQKDEYSAAREERIDHETMKKQKLEEDIRKRGV